MKKHAFIIVLLLTAVFAAGAQKATVNGTLNGMPEGSLAILCAVNGNQLMPIDTLKPDSKGSFHFSVELTQPTLYVLQPNIRDGGSCHLMLTPKDKASIDLLYLPDRHAFKINSCKGSQNIEVYRQFNDIILGAVNQTLQQLAPYQIEQLLMSNKEVLISAFLATFFEQDLDNHAALYTAVRDALIKKYPNDPFVLHLSDKLRGLLAPGMEAPEIAMKDPQGNIRKLSDLRGKYVMIDFWASWCGPCRRENPNVVRLYHKYHDKGFEIYSVSLDRTREAWLKGIQDDGLIWPNHVSDLNGWTSSGGKSYNIMSVPATVLVDPDGKIIARNLRGTELEQKLEEIFN